VALITQANEGEANYLSNAKSSSRAKQPTTSRKNPLMKPPIPGARPWIMTIPGSTEDPREGRIESYMLPPNEETAQFVPPTDPDWLTTTKMGELVMALDADMNVLIVGDAGVGKTAMIKQMCAIRNWPFRRVNLSEGVRESDLFGRWVARGKEMVWVKGPVQVAVEQGHVLLLDEIDFANPSYLVALRALMETDQRQLQLLACDGSVLTPHPQFRVVATANSIGNENRLDYAGANLMNLADLDRYNWTIQLEHLEAAQEIGLLLRKAPGLAKEMAENMVKVVTMVREANANQETTFPFGFRSLLKWAKNYLLIPHANYSLGTSVLAMLDPLEQEYVRGVSEKVFGRN